jgi:hypothetical protein
MALEIVDGRVVFKVDLGKGAGMVTSVKEVSDGMWHHAIAERCVPLRRLGPTICMWREIAQ